MINIVIGIGAGLILVSALIRVISRKIRNIRALKHGKAPAACRCGCASCPTAGMCQTGKLN
jgi:hypothetical protein